MSDSAAPGPIPQSIALREAHGDSIADLLSRAPPFSPEDLARIITYYRIQSAQWEKAEAEGGAKKKPKAGGRELLTQTMSSAEDLGL